MTAKTMVTPAEQAAQRGMGIHKWVNDKIASGSAEVLTDATLYYNLSEDEVVMITQLMVDLDTTSDECTFEPVSCTAVAGGGTPTALFGEEHLATAAAKTSHAPHHTKFCPPIRVRYADGVRSISVRINGNDSSAVVNVAWQGYTDLSL